MFVVFFLDETYYSRRIPAEKQAIKRSRRLRLVGIEQWKSRHQRGTFGRSLLRPFLAVAKVPVLVSFVYYTFTFAWVVGLNTQISALLTNPNVYGFDGKDVGQYPTSFDLDRNPVNNTDQVYSTSLP